MEELKGPAQLFRERFSKCGSQTNSKAKFSGPTPDPLNQKLRGWEQQSLF